MTKYQLMRAFFAREPITIRKVSGIIEAIEHEDGSGSSFNVRMREFKTGV